MNVCLHNVTQLQPNRRISHKYIPPEKRHTSMIFSITQSQDIVVNCSDHTHVVGQVLIVDILSGKLGETRYWIGRATNNFRYSTSCLNLASKFAWRHSAYLADGLYYMRSESSDKVDTIWVNICLFVSLSVAGLDRVLAKDTLT